MASVTNRTNDQHCAYHSDAGWCLRENLCFFIECFSIFLHYLEKHWLFPRRPHPFFLRAAGGGRRKRVFISCSVPGPPKSTENDEYLEQYQCDDRGDKKKPRSFFFYLHIWLKYVLVRFSYKLLVRLWNFEFTLTLRSSLSLL